MRELSPCPVIATANVVLLSIVVVLSGLSIITLSDKIDGHWAGGVPPLAVEGSQGQLCCGAKKTVIVQLCCDARENGDPEVSVQLSCSVKFGSPVKSLKPPKGLLIFCSRIVMLVRVCALGSVLVRVILCCEGLAPNACCGNTRTDGVRVMDC